ncbi:MAG: hypothetical protein J6A75_03355 [Lachnospiraceae bacterium]|nr:hypothetical protein [Lachnospiraceae bacterium]
MKVKETKKVVETVVTTYVAEDGTEFNTMQDCEKYESDKHREKLIKEAEKLRMDIDVCSLDTQGSEINDNNIFAWYEIKSKEDYLTLARVFPNELREDYELPSYPDIMCVETAYYREDAEYGLYEDHYISYLSAMKNDCVQFWEKFGYECTLTKKN